MTGIRMKPLLPLLLCGLTACGAAPREAAPKPLRAAPGVLQIGSIEHPRLTESSGLTAGRRDTNVLWTHTDGGGKKQVLYAMNRAGKHLAEFRVLGAEIEDWEDMASDDQGHLFIGDLGNNDARRSQIRVHQLDEPDLAVARAGGVVISRSWTLRFPGKPFDCESLFVWRGAGYLVSKVFNDERAELHRFSLTNPAPQQTIEFVARLRIESPVTGASLSADGRLLALVAKNGAHVCRIDGDPARAGLGKPLHVKFRHEHIEGCAFVPEGLIATAESREIYLFNAEAFRSGPPAKK